MCVCPEKREMEESWVQGGRVLSLLRGVIYQSWNWLWRRDVIPWCNHKHRMDPTLYPDIFFILKITCPSCTPPFRNPSTTTGDNVCNNCTAPVSHEKTLKVFLVQFLWFCILLLLSLLKSDIFFTLILKEKKIAMVQSCLFPQWLLRSCCPFSFAAFHGETEMFSKKANWDTHSERWDTQVRCYKKKKCSDGSVLPACEG